MKSLTGFSDGELDVALFMLQQGIPLTPTFLARYDRGKILSEMGVIKPFNPKDLTSNYEYVNRLQKGSIVNVIRSNRSLETDWQVLRIVPQTGKILVARGDSVKEVSQEDLLAANQKTSPHPFLGVHSYPELESKLRNIPMIFSEGQAIPRTIVEDLIKQYLYDSTNNFPIERIPACAGLRAAVWDLKKRLTKLTIH